MFARINGIEHDESDELDIGHLEAWIQKGQPLTPLAPVSKSPLHAWTILPPKKMEAHEMTAATPFAAVAGAADMDEEDASQAAWTPASMPTPDMARTPLSATGEEWDIEVDEVLETAPPVDPNGLPPAGLERSAHWAREAQQPLLIAASGDVRRAVQVRAKHARTHFL